MPRIRFCQINTPHFCLLRKYEPLSRILYELDMHRICYSMKLETYAKIGIVSGILVAILVGIDLTLMVLNHEFGYDFRERQYNLSEKQQQEILDGFYTMPEYIAFKDRYPDSRSQLQITESQVRLILTQYEPSRQNGLKMEITQHASDDFVYLEARCDAVDRKSGLRQNAEGGFVFDYIKTTPCVNPSQ